MDSEERGWPGEITGKRKDSRQWTPMERRSHGVAYGRKRRNRRGRGRSPHTYCERVGAARAWGVALPL